MDDTWYKIVPPNIDIIKCDLGDTAVRYLWKCIEKAKVNKKNANPYLAGNISESLYLEDENDYFFENHLRIYCEKYVQEYFQSVAFRNTFSNVRTCKLIMQEFWVNFSNKNEFNPLHCHGGALSFVIWMKIPTRSEEQHDLPISKNTSSPSSSDFMFTYTDILGSILPMQFPMDPEVEGSMVVFPSTLCHQVYPFFNCDSERISISGNIYFDTEVLRGKDGDIKFENTTTRDNERGVPLHDNML
tara:strand:+ start:38 stop:769 length:732 start_codon:yes stop_codon:yes gene_type:complete